MARGTRALGACCLLLSACQGPGAPEIAPKAERLASADRKLQERIRSSSLGWKLDGDGRLATERVPKKLGKISARLPKTADGEWEVSLGAVHRVALVPNGAKPSRVELDGKRAVYRDAYRSTDVIHVADPRYAEQFLILRDSSAPNEFTWNVRLPGELKSVRNGDFGSVEFADESGKAILRIPKPILIDANGTKRDEAMGWDGQRIVVQVDTKGLAFPVLLDPVVEVMGWSRVPLLGNRSSGPAMATLGSTVVLFGGDLIGDDRTWIWDGTKWTSMLTWPRPPARWSGAMASMGSKVVLFGGRDSNTNQKLNDTWEFDGTTWIDRSVPNSPEPRTWHAMAQRKDKVVLFGGYSASNDDLGDTWEWDGKTWKQMQPATSPQPKSGHAMAAFGDNVLLVRATETWEWDGVNWAQRTPAHSFTPDCDPISDCRRTMAQVDGKALLHQGDGTWEWDGTDWQLLATMAGSLHKAAVMASIGPSAILTGNAWPYSQDGEDIGTWVWTGADWILADSSRSPPSCGFAPLYPLMATLGDSVVLRCGTQSTWIFDGSSWTSVEGVPPVEFPQMTDWKGGVLLIDGDSSGRIETRAFDGKSWTGPLPTSLPVDWNLPPHQPMARLGDEAVLVLENGSSSEWATWKWDGTDWTLQHPATPTPVSRRLTTAGDAILLLGWPGGMWSYDGADWSSLGPVNPALYCGSNCTLAPNGSGALLFNESAETWEWNSGAWEEGPAVPWPTFGNLDRPMALAARGSDETVLFGITLATGFGMNSDSDSTWVYRSVRAQGSDCTDDTECLSNRCVDGICCDQLCEGSCEACDVAGSEGICTPISGASHGKRAACNSTGVCGGECKGMIGRCEYPDSSVTCRAASCINGTATLAASCDGAGGCPDAQTLDCSPYRCGTTVCAGDCMVDADCAKGSYCPAGKCIPQTILGSACNGTRECASGFCADGLCCDKGCIGRCEACDLVGKVGTCTPVIGAPHGSRKACLGDESVCSGSCDGGNPTGCTYPDTKVNCRAASCANDVAVVAANCDGLGACAVLQTQQCAPYHCAATMCAGNCVKDEDCGAGFFCPAGICKPTAILGVKCAADRECSSGQCVDGVCCSSSCDEQCEACDLPGQAGSCKPVVGQPRGKRDACPGTGPCAAVCDGQDRSSCSPPSSGALCRPASCGFGIATAASYCNGSGGCPQAIKTSCDPFACAGDTCATKCTTMGDCAAGHYCHSGICVIVESDGTVCAGDGECAHGHCVDGVCCESACGEQCVACDVAGAIGKCTQVTGAPHGNRTNCESGAQCRSGACTQPVTPETQGCGCGSGGAPGAAMLVLLVGLARRKRARSRESGDAGDQ